MNDTDIQFGDLEEAKYGERRRPDHDMHFAVVAIGTPASTDLPIFVDMDVLNDMEAHARENPDVELGGVLLGGQYIDPQRGHFVMIRDSIRAEAYESSRGHFKFTQETWTRIGRRREEFNDDLHMVGWYHTHPGWGIFLSSMDQFICDNFFNRTLDVAFVIDPKANERGWFYWRRDAEDRLPRCQGFFVTAARFRHRDLARYVSTLKGNKIMQGGYSLNEDDVARREVVHIWRPQLGWLGALVIGILGLQLFVLLAVIMALSPRSTGDVASSASQRGIAEVVEKEGSIEQLLGKIIVDEQGHVDVSAVAREYAELRRQSDELRRTRLLLAELTDNYERLQQELRSTREPLDKSRPTNDDHLVSAAPTTTNNQSSRGERIRQWIGFSLFAVLTTVGLAGPWVMRRFQRIGNTKATPGSTPDLPGRQEVNAGPPSS